MVAIFVGTLVYAAMSDTFLEKIHVREYRELVVVNEARRLIDLYRMSHAEPLNMHSVSDLADQLARVEAPPGREYNNGSKTTRPILTQRVYDGLVASEANLTSSLVPALVWKTADILPSLRSETLEPLIATKTETVLNRNRVAYELAWMHRAEKKIPFVLSSLHLGGVNLLHLPGEPFIEYKLKAQQLRPSDFDCMAAYGDSGARYYPTKEEYPHDGCEVSAALSGPEADDLLTEGIRQILSA